VAEIFISYARKDQEFVLKLAGDLRQRGVDIWLDQDEIEAGSDRWDDQVEAALAACPKFLIVLSPASVESQNVKDELGFALDERKPIFPILYQQCTIPFRVRRFQRFDFTVDYDKPFAALVAVLTSETVPLTSLPEIDDHLEELTEPLVSAHPELAETIAVLNEYLYKQQHRLFRLEPAADLLNIQPGMLERLLGLYENRGIVERVETYLCPQDEEILEINENNTLWCDLCTTEYEPDECEQGVAYRQAQNQQEPDSTANDKD
jgi:hypothetical protein